MNGPAEELIQELGGSSGPATLTYRKVWASGTFDAAHEVILFGRSMSAEEPGNHVLTPLVLDDGSAILVDRGWVPLSMEVPPIDEAAPPSQRVRVTGLLYAAEASGEPASQAITSLPDVDITRIGGALPYPLAPVYLRLQSQSPPQEGELPRLEPLPPLDEGPHLNYAIQWFIFASISLIGFAVLTVRESGRRPGS